MSQFLEKLDVVDHIDVPIFIARPMSAGVDFEKEVDWNMLQKTTSLKQMTKMYVVKNPGRFRESMSGGDRMHWM